MSPSTSPEPVLAPPSSVAWRDHVIGIDDVVTVLGGARVRHVNLDNAASTPAFDAVADAVTRFLPASGSVHRGTGHRSRLSTAAYERAREVVGDFVGADPRRTSSSSPRTRPRRSTGSPRRCRSRRLGRAHHRPRAPLQRPAVAGDGPRSSTSARPPTARSTSTTSRQLARHRGRVAVLAVSGASNVTGRRAADPRPRRAGARGRWPDRRRRRPAGPAPPDRHAAPRRSGTPRLRRAVSATSCTPRSAAARLSAVAACIGRPDLTAGGGTVQAVTLDDVAGPTCPTGRRRAPRTSWRRRPGGGDRGADVDRDGATGPHETDLRRTPSPGWPAVPGLRSTARPARTDDRRGRAVPWPASHTDWSPPSLATSTASGCAAGASAPTRTSPTCSGSTGRRGRVGPPRRRRRPARGPGHGARSASASTTTAPTSTGRWPGCATSPTARSVAPTTSSPTDRSPVGADPSAGPDPVRPRPRVVPAPPDDDLLAGGLTRPSRIVRTMHNTRQLTRKLLVSAAAATLLVGLAACGGDDDDDSSAGTAAPATTAAVDHSTMDMGTETTDATATTDTRRRPSPRHRQFFQGGTRPGRRTATPVGGRRGVRGLGAHVHRAVVDRCGHRRGRRAGAAVVIVVAAAGCQSHQEGRRRRRHRGACR